MILAIDTATRYAGVALYDGRAVVAEHCWRSNANHTVELMPSIMQTLAQQALEARDLAAYVVAIGPGSFTGLRIGLSVAKGMAFVTQKPLLGIPTLDVLGYAYARQDADTCVIIEAGRRRYCVATYRRTDDSLEQLGDLRTLSTEELISSIHAPTYFCGEIGPTLGEELKKGLGDRARILSPARSVRRPGYLAEMGWRRLERGERDDLARLSPIYIESSAGASL